MVNARLTLEIARILKERELTQAQAAKVLGIQQAHVSALVRNRAGSFSVGRLMEFLAALGSDVAINITPKTKGAGNMSVVIA